jgi:branched-subunit amino acid aminotransferase/4-amino-4-deoxychorismate lyase
MIQYHHINGALTDAPAAAIGLYDLGLLRGYGIFDFFLVKNKKALFFQDYMDRFSRSADLLGLELPFSREDTHDHIQELLQANKLNDAAIRLVLTGGYADDSYTPSSPNYIIMQHPLPGVPDQYYQQGIKLMSYRFERELPEIKSTNYLTGIRIRNLLKNAGAPEVLYHNGHTISESARSNFFIVTPDGILVTPDDKILQGITRKQILLLAQEHHIPIQTRALQLSELSTAAEAFLTSTTKGVLPVTQIDDMTIGNGTPGRISQQLMQAFTALTHSFI